MKDFARFAPYRPPSGTHVNNDTESDHDLAYLQPELSSSSHLTLRRGSSGLGTGPSQYAVVDVATGNVDEHGIGLHKMDFLVDEAGAGAVELMRTIKRALDPKNIMNPGKIFSWN